MFLKIIREAQAQCVPDKFIDYTASDAIMERAGRTWALFHGHWYALNYISDKATGEIMVPVILNWKIMGRWPDEGRSGIMHLYRSKRGRWVICWPTCEWIPQEEFESAQAIRFQNGEVR